MSSDYFDARDDGKIKLHFDVPHGLERVVCNLEVDAKATLQHTDVVCILDIVVSVREWVDGDYATVVVVL
jgi:hypothetical protein